MLFWTLSNSGGQFIDTETNKTLKAREDAVQMGFRFPNLFTEIEHGRVSEFPTDMIQAGKDVSTATC